jgi:hypothetical protein
MLVSLHCYDKIPEKLNLREERISWMYGSNGRKLHSKLEALNSNPSTRNKKGKD